MAEVEFEDLATSGPDRGHVFLVGIGGTGMRAIAEVLVGMGLTVSGSDAADGPAVDHLRTLGIEVHVGHRAENLGSPDLVAASTAVPQANPELTAAREAGIPTWTRSRLLTAITRAKKTIAIGGTHGKTTTSAILTLAMLEAGYSPSYVIGSNVSGLGSGANWAPDGEWFIAEADESDGTALELEASASVVTSAEPDHIAHWGTTQDLYEAFGEFVENTDGPCAICIDDSQARSLVERGDAVITYGANPSADVRIENYVGAGVSCQFDLTYKDETYPVSLAVPGMHNAQNAAGAFAIGVAIGADPALLAAGLGAYRGVARRFENRGEANGVVFVDDYAHLPTEIEATIAAAKDGDWNRVVVTFQPHRFTRTRDLVADFAKSFGGADVLVLTDIYTAGESPIEGISGHSIRTAVEEAGANDVVVYQPSLADVADFLTTELRPGDLCLTLGAGDLTTVPDVVLDRIKP